MVDQSDLPFRLLCRNYNTHLCFTPMIHTKLYCECLAYRGRFQLRRDLKRDRPLIAQICGSDPATVIPCVMDLQDYCDGIDINCGCPQNIAKRGNYGAFLLEKEETLLRLVQQLIPVLKVPLSVKVRLLPSASDPQKPDLARSLDLYDKLVDSGIHMLTVHGRTRHQKSLFTGAADWSAVKTIVDRYGHRIPVIANGSIGNLREAYECLKQTGADGVMSSEAILEDPSFFSTENISRLQISREYIDLGKEYPPDVAGQGSGVKCMRNHLHRFLHPFLQEDMELRHMVQCAITVEALEEALDILEDRQSSYTTKDSDNDRWYMRHRRLVNHNGRLVSAGELKYQRDRLGSQKAAMEDEDNGSCMINIFE